MANMFIISISLLVVSQVNVARSLSEPECGCSSDLRLMYTFLDEKFTMKQEIKELKLTVDDLQAKLSKLGIDMKGNTCVIKRSSKLREAKSVYASWYQKVLKRIKVKFSAVFRFICRADYIYIKFYLTAESIVTSSLESF